MEFHQCTVCELKFRFSSELDDHIATDHPEFKSESKTVEDSLLGAAHRSRKRSPRYPSTYKPDRSG